MSEKQLFKDFSVKEVEQALAKALHQLSEQKYQVNVVELSFDQGPSGTLNDIVEVRMVVRRRAKYKL